MVGEIAQSAGEMAVFFGVFLTCTLLGLLVIIFVKKLKKLTHGADEARVLSSVTEPE